MKFKKTIILLLTIILLSSCYYVTQGYNLLNTYSKAEKIDKIIKKENLPKDEKELLLLVKDIKKYAVNTLGLKKNKNYTKYIQHKRNYLVDVVYACKTDSFDQYQWNYFIMGKMPYKGFFNIEKAKKEAAKLDGNDYDIYIGKVQAFSTLGILSDPIFSFMKSYTVYELADTIFHEQTHATIFLKKYIDFNENLANYIGNKGALQFIKDNYGMDSELYINTINLINDSIKYRELMNNLYNELSEVYNQNISKKEKLNFKKNIINNWKIKFKNNYEKNFITNAYNNVPNLKINNSYITIFRTYTKDVSIFNELYEKCDNDLIKFIEIIKGLKKYKGDPQVYIKNIIDTSPARGGA